MSEAVELSQEALETIGSYVRKNLPSWMEEVRPQALSARDLELAERTVRVEEELKAQRDLMRQGFDHMEKRFEQGNQRFEEMNLRFGDMSSHMNRWFTVMTIMLGLVGIAVTVSSFVS